MDNMTPEMRSKIDYLALKYGLQRVPRSDRCLECGSKLHIQEGCATCRVCGYSRCG